jgi:hypothetical protein
MAGGWKVNGSYDEFGDFLVDVKHWSVEDSNGNEKIVVTNRDEDASDVGRYIAEGRVYDPGEI